MLASPYSIYLIKLYTSFSYANQVLVNFQTHWIRKWNEAYDSIMWYSLSMHIIIQ